MINLLKMDLFRLFRRKTLYIMIIALSAMTLSMLFLADPKSLTMNGILGVMEGVSMENFMSAGSGLGLTYTLMSIMLSFFVCDDFSSGFAKNIFTVHSKKSDYIVAKILSMMVGNAVLMLFSLLESLGFCLIAGIAIENISGILCFWIQKWILSAAFSAAILFVSLLLRNKGLGFLFACLFGTGGLVMGLEWGLEALKIPNAAKILEFTMYGASTLPTLSFQISSFIHILLVTIIWGVVYAVLGIVVLNRKEI